MNPIVTVPTLAVVKKLVKKFGVKEVKKMLDDNASLLDKTKRISKDMDALDTGASESLVKLRKKQLDSFTKDADTLRNLSKTISDTITKKQTGGPLRPIPAGNKGLPKLPKPVRNKMGFMKRGGKIQKRAGGGVALRGFGATRKI